LQKGGHWTRVPLQPVVNDGGVGAVVRDDAETHSRPVSGFAVGKRPEDGIPFDPAHRIVAAENPHAERSVDLTQRVPRRTRGEGRLVIRGGGMQADEECFFGGCVEGGKEETSPASFDELLADLSGAEHSYDLISSLGLRGGVRTSVAPQAEIILGRRSQLVFVVR